VTLETTKASQSSRPLEFEPWFPAGNMNATMFSAFAANEYYWFSHTSILIPQSPGSGVGAA